MIGGKSHSGVSCARLLSYDRFYPVFILIRSPHLLLSVVTVCLAMACEWQRPAATDFDLQGHRGARGERPENSLPGFRHAVELGIPTLEMDVVVSADSQLVVSHEAWMSDLICSYPDGTPIPPDSARAINLFRMRAEEIAAFDCGSRVHPAFPDQRSEPTFKPPLSAVVDSVEGWAASLGRSPLLYNIETKSSPGTDGQDHPNPNRFVALLYSLLAEKNVLHRTTVQSFDVRTLQVLHEMDPAVKTSLLVSRTARWADRLGDLGFTPDILSPSWGHVTDSMVDSVHAMGMKIIPWTVNESADMLRLASLGVDGLITDYPTRAKAILQIP